MKLIASFILLISNLCLSVSGQSTFEFLFSRPSHDISRSLVEDSLQNIYFPVENLDFTTIIKLNPEGYFTDSIQITNPDGTCSIEELILVGDSLIIGLGNWSTGAENNLWYLRLDIELNILDDKRLFSGNYFLSGFYQTMNHNGNILFVAAYIPDNEFPDICMYEVTVGGEIVRFQFFDSGDQPNLPHSLLEDMSDSTYIAFTLNNIVSQRVGMTYVHHVDSNFNVISIDTGVGWLIDNQVSTMWINDSIYLLAGRQWLGGFDETDFGILKVTSNDSILSSNYFGKPDTLEAAGLYKNLDYISANNIFFGGATNVIDYPFQWEPSWIVLSIIDTGLNVINQKYYGGDAYYLVNAVLATQDSGCIMACTKFDYMAGADAWDVYILKVNKDGLLVNTSEHQIINDQVCYVYPNPGCDHLNINSSKDGLSIQLFDLTGKMKFVNDMDKGRNVVPVDGLSPGLYIYNIYDERQRIIQSGKWIKE